ncbi:hypothetical protein [Granulicoccus sp. GXG6511]|uniref:hypothetical protein n=1 Tax=Granulicoccus sp. GXG6511 TaxID=3381351 RepID=UPI003D7D1989
MGHFEVRLTAPLAATVAYDRVLDLDAHTATIPFTTVRVLPGPGPLSTGTRFVARTALGPIGIDDSMIVEEFTRPTGDRAGVCRIRKTGRWVLGAIELSVEAAGPPADRQAATVRWSQDIAIRGLSRVADPLVTLIASHAYRLVLRRLLATARRHG